MVYNINLEARLQFSFPIEVKDSEEEERVISELCGMSDGRRDGEVIEFQKKEDIRVKNHALYVLLKKEPLTAILKAI